MRDWFQNTAKKAQLTTRVTEHLYGITVDMLNNKSEPELLIQVYLPYQHDDGFIYLRKLAPEHDDDFPTIVEIDWYEIVFTIDNSKLFIYTYSQPSTKDDSKTPHFNISVDKSGCIGNGNWKRYLGLKSIQIQNLEEIIPSEKNPVPSKRVFVSGSLRSEESRKHRHIATSAIASKFPMFLPVSLDLTDNFIPSASLSEISRCDLFILIIADFTSPWVTNEFQWANQKNIPTNIFVSEKAAESKNIIEFLSNTGAQYFIKYNPNSLPNLVTDWLQDNSNNDKPIIDDKYKQNTNLIPELININIKKYDWIRIALIQIDYSLDKEYPFRLKNHDQTKDKIFETLNLAEQNKADLIVFPELSGSSNIHSKFNSTINEDYTRIIIEGSYYSNDVNLSQLVIGKDRFLIKKNHYSKYEDTPIPRKLCKSAKSLRIFSTLWGTVCPLICDDFRHESNKVASLADILIVQSFNPKPDRFSNRATVIVEDHHNYVLIVNCAKFGGTSIFGILDRNYLNDLTNAGLRKEDSSDCIIAEIPESEEAILLADLCMSRKHITVPTPLLDEYANIREVQKILLEF